MITFSTPEEIYSFLVKQTTYKQHEDRIQSIEEILSSKRLDCWEAVEFQRYFLSKMTSVKNIRTYYMGFYRLQEDNNYVPADCHTVILFEYKNKVYYMETSWRNRVCFKAFSNWNTVVNFVVKQFFENVGEFENKTTSEYVKKHKLVSFQVYQYSGIKEHATDVEFINKVTSGKLIYDTTLVGV